MRKDKNMVLTPSAEEVEIAKDRLILQLTEWYNRATDDTDMGWREYQVMIDIVKDVFDGIGKP